MAVQAARISLVPVEEALAHRPEAVLTSSVAIGPVDTSFHVMMDFELEQREADIGEPTVVSGSVRHSAPSRIVPSGCGCQRWAATFEQVASTTAVPEIAMHLPG